MTFCPNSISSSHCCLRDPFDWAASFVGPVQSKHLRQTQHKPPTCMLTHRRAKMATLKYSRLGDVRGFDMIAHSSTSIICNMAGCDWQHNRKHAIAVSIRMPTCLLVSGRAWPRSLNLWIPFTSPLPPIAKQELVFSGLYRISRTNPQIFSSRKQGGNVTRNGGPQIGACLTI